MGTGHIKSALNAFDGLGTKKRRELNEEFGINGNSELMGMRN
jgi:hypothetical protein